MSSVLFAQTWHVVMLASAKESWAVAAKLFPHLALARPVGNSGDGSDLLLPKQGHSWNQKKRGGLRLPFEGER